MALIGTTAFTGNHIEYYDLTGLNSRSECVKSQDNNEQFYKRDRATSALCDALLQEKRLQCLQEHFSQHAERIDFFSTED